jgi:hypothetical protein
MRGPPRIFIYLFSMRILDGVKMGPNPTLPTLSLRSWYLERVPQRVRPYQVRKRERRCRKGVYSVRHGDTGDTGDTLIISVHAFLVISYGGL